MSLPTKTVEVAPIYATLFTLNQLSVIGTTATVRHDFTGTYECQKNEPVIGEVASLLLLSCIETKPDSNDGESHQSAGGCGHTCTGGA